MTEELAADQAQTRALGLRMALLLGLAWSVVGSVFWKLGSFGPGMPKPSFTAWETALAVCGALFGASLVWGSLGIRRYIPEYLRTVSLIALVYLLVYGISELLFMGFFSA